MSYYRSTLPRDRRRLLERYRSVHSARKVVGVGSVGTRAWIMLMLGRDDADPLFPDEGGARVGPRALPRQRDADDLVRRRGLTSEAILGALWPGVLTANQPARFAMA